MERVKEWIERHCENERVLILGILVLIFWPLPVVSAIATLVAMVFSGHGFLQAFQENWLGITVTAIIAEFLWWNVPD